jgi:hypothetical protein
LRVVEQNGVHEEEEFPEGNRGGFVRRQGRCIRVCFGCRQDASQCVVQGTVVFTACGGVERAPDVASVGWQADIKVMEPEEDRGPCGWQGLGVEVHVFDSSKSGA